MYKEIHAFSRKPLKKLARLDFVARPHHGRLIDENQHRIQRRGIIAPVMIIYTPVTIAALLDSSTAFGTAAKVEGLNYLADTLLFGGVYSRARQRDAG